MKEKMFERFSDEGKWHDYYNFKTFECRTSITFTIIILILSLFIDLHGNLEEYLIALQNTSLYVMQAFVGLLGIIIAGVAIIISIFTKDLVNIINKLNKNNPIYKVLISFEFLAFNIGISILLLLLVYFTLNTPIDILPKIAFYITLVIIIYYILFIIFYLISLIGNIIRLFYISHIYKDIDKEKKNLYVQANEVRIDFILNLIISQTNLDSEEFKSKLDEYLDASEMENKKEIKEYFKQYYS